MVMALIGGQNLSMTIQWPPFQSKIKEDSSTQLLKGIYCEALYCDCRSSGRLLKFSDPASQRCLHSKAKGGAVLYAYLI